MLRSHLLDAFLASAWNLHGEVYARLSDLLEAHVLGRKAELRERDAGMFDDGGEPERRDEAMADHLTADGVAVIAVRGVLAMHADQVNGDCQPRGRSYESISEQLALAVADPAVRGILLHLETPGGSACGCQELYDQISTAAQAKPVHAYLAGYCFSAGYYLASACDRVTASSRSTHLGSIGTVMALWDSSAANEKAGFKRVVIRSGAYKALAQDGEPLGEGARAELQRECDAYAAAFHDAVRAGRGLDDQQAAAVCNGRTFLAAEAITLGLIDAIESLSSTLSTLIAGTAGQEQTMFGKKKPDPAPAAGDPKNPTTANEQQEGLSKADYAALAQQFPEAGARLQELDAAGTSADEIRGTLLSERVTALRGQLTQAQAKITEQATALAAAQAEIATFKTWKGNLTAVDDPGSAAATGTAQTADAIATAWKNSETLRANFALGGIASYVEHLRLKGQLTAGEAKDITAALTKA